MIFASAEKNNMGTLELQSDPWQSSQEIKRSGPFGPNRLSNALTLLRERSHIPTPSAFHQRLVEGRGDPFMPEPVVFDMGARAWKAEAFFS